MDIPLLQAKNGNFALVDTTFPQEPFYVEYIIQGIPAQGITWHECKVSIPLQDAINEGRITPEDAETIKVVIPDDFFKQPDWNDEFIEPENLM